MRRSLHAAQFIGWFSLVAACEKAPPNGAPGAASAAVSTPPTVDAGAAAETGPPAEVTGAKTTGKAVETPAGTAVESGSEVRVANKPIFPPPSCPANTKDGCAKVKALASPGDGIKILRHFDGPGGPRSILLLQVVPAGNACNGGPLFFVRLGKDAPPQYSDVFDHCGGPDPMVGAMADKVLINVPAGPPNRGTGTVPAKTMEYDIASGALRVPEPKKKSR